MNKSDHKYEAAIQRKIIEAIGSMDGVVCHRNNCGTATYGGARIEYGVGGKGAPDLVCEVRAHDGFWRLLWIEVKAPDGVVEPHQTHWHAVARGQGRETIVARCVSDALDAVEKVSRGLMTFYDRGRNVAMCEGEREEMAKS